MHGSKSMDEIAVIPRCTSENVKLGAADTKASKDLISIQISPINSIQIDCFSHLLLIHLSFPAHLQQVPAISSPLLETVVISFVHLLLITSSLTEKSLGLTANSRAQIKTEILLPGQAINHQCKTLHQHQ